MAEPASPLPVSPQKIDPIPWPERTEATTKRTRTASQHRLDELLESGSRVVLRSWDSTQRAVSNVTRRTAETIRRLKRDRPLEIIAGVAGAAFLLGVGLRIWRSRHE